MVRKHLYGLVGILSHPDVDGRLAKIGKLQRNRRHLFGLAQIALFERTFDRTMRSSSRFEKC